MKTILILMTILNLLTGFGQAVQEFHYKGVCYYLDGTPYNPADLNNQRYMVRKHHKTTKIEIGIKSI